MRDTSIGHHMKEVLSTVLPAYQPIAIALTLLLTACGKDHPVAEKIVIGKIWTGTGPEHWIEAMAVWGDTIVATGTRSEIEKFAGTETERIEASDGSIIVPGFIDCHVHFIEGGYALSSVQLRNAKSKEEFINNIKAFAKSVPKGTWIMAGDWDHQNWGGELPTRDWIDSVTRDNPVWINRLDGHMSLANTLALKAAGVTDNVKDVQGGTIVRSKGRLTGIFKDKATNMIEAVVPEPTDAQKDAALQAAMNYVASHGVTSVHNTSGYHDVFERAHTSGTLKTRIYAGMPLTEWRVLIDEMNKKGTGDKWLKRGVLKAFVDGSLGSHTAAFFKPFEDTPRDSGFFVVPEEVLYRNMRSADSAGLKLMIHAIGDRAISSLLNSFERIVKENGDRDRRLRIEHAQHLRPDDFSRFAALGVIASVQPYHAIDDGRWAEKFIGHQRALTTYAFKSFLDAQTRMIFGSDWFVAPADPLYGIYAAVTRRTLDEKDPAGWIPEQKITVAQALQAYTRDAAYASFDDDLKGTLEAGKLADFVLLERDITAIPPEEIRDVKVMMTVVGGKTVFRR